MWLCSHISQILSVGDKIINQNLNCGQVKAYFNADDETQPEFAIKTAHF
jgi:hypothetical protein